MTPSRINKSIPRKERGWNLPPNPQYSWGLSEQSCSAAEVGGVSSSVWRSSLFGFIPPSVIANGASSLPVSSMPLAGRWASIETSERPYSRRGAPMIHQLRINEIFEENKAAFHACFRDHAARIMARHDFVAMRGAKTDWRSRRTPGSSNCRGSRGRDVPFLRADSAGAKICSASQEPDTTAAPEHPA
jgi:hypothetical protein